MSIEMGVRTKLLARAGVGDGDAAIHAFEASRAAFDSWAHLDAPLLPADPHDALQVELFRWQSRNFGSPRPCEIACGIAEEVGEGVKAGVELSTADGLDAVGDVMVYAAQLATAHRLAFSFAIGAAKGKTFDFFAPNAPSGTELISIAAGLACHIQLKAAQGIRAMLPGPARFGTFLALTMLVRGLDRGHDPSLAWRVVSEQVMKRDWVKYPATGKP